MIITLKDGSTKEYAQRNVRLSRLPGTSARDWHAWQRAGEVDGEVVDLRTVVDKDCESEYPDL